MSDRKLSKPGDAIRDVNSGLVAAEAARPLSRSGALYALALGTFAVGTEGFMIAAILPTISQSLQVSVEAAGQLVTVFALVYAVSSPILTAMTAHHDRRRLLMGSLAAFALANLIASVAPGYWALAGARVLLALAAGLYVPNANAFAGALVPASHRGRALAIVNGGITVAVALGVPLGAFIGTHLGWRATFLGVAAMSAVALAVLAARLPRDIASSPPATLRARLAVIAHPGAFMVLMTTTVWAIGAYTVYTYISPFLAMAAGMTTAQAGFALTLLGISAVGGVALGGVTNDRYGARRVQGLALLLMALAFAGLTAAALAFAPHALPAILPLIVLWGLSAWSFFPPQQNRLIGVVGAANAPVALSLNASFMYVGFSLGALLGSIVIASSSVIWIGAAGAACVLGAAALSTIGWRRG
ncbi:MFS transporter [Bradyrhizobium sp. Cp5.3]|uniref:MFS transporter n=1 Tax=Bradyrhizobium sp. Cp5.3 TaxID=443598 RepID=UPI00040C6834|nr:MFS transporter [Bradyrhizobium sp. Cp5.3]